MELVRLTAADYEEAVDFLDFVFSKAHRPHSFEEILPIIYRPTDEHMQCNFAVRENGRIRGIVGLFPAEMKVGNEVLKVGGIGGVSAHPRDKGKGWMKLLMGAAAEEMEKTGVDLSWLSGLRQRYQYFGYEKTGIMLEYTISQTNLRQVFQGEDAAGLQLIPIGEKDSEYIKKAKELHDGQVLHCVRSMEDFWLFAKAVCTTPLAAVNDEGKMLGYMVLTQDKCCITEIFAEDEDILTDMIRCCMQQEKEEEIKVLLAPWQEKAARRLGRIAEEFCMRDCGNFRIFNWEKVVGSLFAVKNQMEKLMDGSLLLGIRGYGTLELKVENGVTSCTKTDKTAEVELDPHTASRVLFGQCPVCFVEDIPAKANMLLNAWCPLPLCWLIQNHV